MPSVSSEKRKWVSASLLGVLGLHYALRRGFICSLSFHPYLPPPRASSGSGREGQSLLTFLLQLRFRPIRAQFCSQPEGPNASNCLPSDVAWKSNCKHLMGGGGSCKALPSTSHFRRSSQAPDPGNKHEAELRHPPPPCPPVLRVHRPWAAFSSLLIPSSPQLPGARRRRIYGYSKGDLLPSASLCILQPAIPIAGVAPSLF